MTLLLLGEGCPFVPPLFYGAAEIDEDEEIILLAYFMMAKNEPDAKPE